MEENNNQDQTNINKSFFKEWLERLQQESWQLELIISGFALLGVYNSRGFLADYWVSVIALSETFIPVMIYQLLNVGWKIFFVNLLIHVIFRSLWIGAIGLRYVSGEINYDRLNYSPYFTEFLRKKVGDYDDFIERLEKVCSVIFSYTFLLFLFFLSALCLCIALVVPFLISDYLDLDMKSSSQFFSYWFFIYGSFGLVVFFDFITLGILKKIENKTFNRIYMVIFRFYSTISLSFLYRPLLYNFIDNKYTRRLFFLSLPYIFLIAFGHKLLVDNTTPHIAEQSFLFKQGAFINDNYYEDLHQKRLKLLSEEDVKMNTTFTFIFLLYE